MSNKKPGIFATRTAGVRLLPVMLAGIALWGMIAGLTVWAM